MYINRTVFSEEHEAYRDTVARFMDEELVPYHAQWEKEGIVPREAWKKAGDVGILLPAIPDKYGAPGGDRLFSSIVIEEQAKRGLSGPGFTLHSDIVAPYILAYGTEEQKQAFLPKMAAGEMIGAIAMTEPGTGSDLQSVKTTAIREGDEYVINGQKTFITNGINSDLVILVTKTDPELGAKGISLILVEATREGFTKGRNLDKIGMKAQDTAELFFDNVRVPVTNLLGKEGTGFYMLMQELAWERMQIAIGGIASAESIIEETATYTKERKVFGQPIAGFQNTRFKLAELKTQVQIGRVFVDKCLELIMKKELDASTAAMAKMWCSDLNCKVIDECLQLHGGYGYMWEYRVARAYADARVSRIYGGSNEIMKELVARTFD